MIEKIKARLTEWLIATQTNFWFVPAAIAGVSVVAAFAVIQIDFEVARSEFLSPIAQFLKMPVESARLALSTIAGSMITVASLVFSMTLVALTTVSQQLGPRVLMRFLDDRPTQVMLGLFIATFLFSLILLLNVTDDAVAGSVPGLGVALAATLSIIALGSIIQFFEHVSRRIQADSLIAELGDDLLRASEGFVTLGQQSESLIDDDEMAELDRQFQADRTRSLSMEASGYLRRFSTADAVPAAKDADVIVRAEISPGAFVLAGVPVLTIAARDDGKVSEAALEALAKCVFVGPRRTPEAAVEFEIAALVEVGLRALSPGVNDPFTAIACIDRLTAGIAGLAGREGEQRVVRDSENVVRFVHAPEPFERHLDRAFDPLIAAAQGNRMVIDRIDSALGALETVVEIARYRDPIRAKRRRVRALTDTAV